MLKNSAPIIIVVAVVFLALETFKISPEKFSFGWAGVTILATYLFLATVL